MKSLNDMLRDIQKRYGVMAIVLAFAGVLSAAVVVAYSTLSSNQQVRVSASLQENFTVRTMTEPLSLTLRREATGWKIVAFDDDKWNE